MAVYNTGSDSANTAVRAFLTKVGEYYLEESFNTSSRKGKGVWEKIKEEFNNCCAYCGENKKLEIEHLIMFNKEECGLHHPGNIVPTCRECNKRKKNEVDKYDTWDEHLRTICTENEYDERKRKIYEHIEKYKYPKLTSDEIEIMKKIADSLYKSIKSEVDNSFNSYKEEIVR